ncbi:MAG: hypothetical protein Q8R11_00210 [bacterium]|nr:hypothetical protein [bacterium]
MERKRLFHLLADAAVSGKVNWTDFIRGRLTFSLIVPYNNQRPLSRLSYIQSFQGTSNQRMVRIEDFSTPEGRIFELTPSDARVYIEDDVTGRRSPSRRATDEELEILYRFHERTLSRFQRPSPSEVPSK